MFYVEDNLCLKPNYRKQCKLLAKKFVEFLFLKKLPHRIFIVVADTAAGTVEVNKIKVIPIFVYGGKFAVMSDEGFLRKHLFTNFGKLPKTC